MAPLQAELIELDWAQVPAQVRAVSAHRSLVVLLTSLDSGAPEEGLIPMAAHLAQQHVVVVASVRDPLLGEMLQDRTTAAQVFRAAAAERALLEREAVSIATPPARRRSGGRGTSRAAAAAGRRVHPTQGGRTAVSSRRNAEPSDHKPGAAVNDPIYQRALGGGF